MELCVRVTFRRPVTDGRRAGSVQSVNLQQYITVFRKQQIDGALLLSLDSDVLIEDFGFKRFDAIKLFKFAREGWIPKVEKESYV